MTRLLLSGLLFVLLISSGVLAQSPDTIWTRTYGGAESESFQCAAALSNDCYAVGGYSASYGYPDDVLIVKLDANGDTVWTNTFGDAYFDYVHGIAESHDGQLVAAGKHSAGSGSIRTAWLFQTDSTGALDWEQNYTGTYDLETEAMVATADSGFMLVGYTGATLAKDFWMLKTDVLGDSVWFTTFGGGDDDRPTALMQTADGGYIIVGTSKSFGAGDIDVWVVRTDAAGDTLWTRVFGGDSNELDPVIDATLDGNYIVATSSSNPISGLYDPYLIKIQPDGDTLWTRFATCDRSVSTFAVCHTSDGGYIVGGTANYGYPLGSQVYIARLDANADTVWTKSVGDDGTDRTQFIHEASNHDIMLLGQWYGGTSWGDFYGIRLEPSILDVTEFPREELPVRFSLAQNYPNPFNPGTQIVFELARRSTVTLDVFNVLGRHVATLVDRPLSAGEYRVPWDGCDQNGQAVSTGVYFYRLQADDYTASRKMVLLK